VSSDESKGLIKMAQLLDLERRAVLIPRLEIADSFFKRFKGLLGTEKIAEDYGLVFRSCESVHSYLMKTKFDVIFLDEEMRVVEVVCEVGPRRIIRSKAGKHCIECAPGLAKRQGIEPGMLVEIID
jgi:hypothetical protein